MCVLLLLIFLVKAVVQAAISSLVIRVLRRVDSHKQFLSMDGEWEMIDEPPPPKVVVARWRRIARVYVRLCLEASYAGAMLQWWGTRKRLGRC